MAAKRTSIEQSKKLLELGLDPETSDMFYWIDQQGLDNLEMGHYITLDRDIPCWSLSALLEVLPKIEGEYPQLIRGSRTELWYAKCKRYGIYKDGRDSYLETFNSENPLEPVFEMLCWLLRDKYIAKY